jgi:hypothetical protein
MTVTAPSLIAQSCQRIALTNSDLGWCQPHCRAGKPFAIT